MHDALELENHGVPSVVLVTKPFASQARAMATIRGVSDYEYTLIDHPMGSLNIDEVRGRARVALPQVLDQLVHVD